MKQIFRFSGLFCTLALMLSATLVSCNNDVKPGPGATTFGVSTDSLVFDAKGGTKSFEIKCAAEWIITTIDDDELITSVSQSSGYGNMEITVTVAQTELRPDQSARVVITDSNKKQVTVDILQITERYIRADNDFFDVGSQSGHAQFEIQTNVEAVLELEIEGQEWLSVEKQENSNYKINIKSNSQNQPRAGSVTLSGEGASKTITIRQSEYSDGGVLMELYNSMDGANWRDVNWMTTPQISQWTGITLDKDNRVTAIDLSNRNLKGTIPEQINQLSELTKLNLGGNDVTIKHHLSGLKKLEIIYLWGPSTGEDPVEGLLEDLLTISSIKEINLSNVNLSCEIPTTIGKAKNLTLLILSDTKLKSTNISALKDATALEVLNLSSNNLTGELPDELSAGCTDLDLSNNNFTGAFPTCLRNMGDLTFLSLANNAFKSEIPEWLCDLTQLTSLNLTDNEFIGQIPQGIGNLLRLKLLNLSYNQLTGGLPPSLSQIDLLRELYVKSNSLSGEIDESIKNCRHYPSWVENGYLCVQNGNGFTNCR